MKPSLAAHGSGEARPAFVVARAVLWDNDGVLVDTEALYFRATRETLDRVGVALDPQSFARISLGQGRSLFDLARDHGFDDEALAELRAERDQRYTEILREGVQVMPGVQDALESLYGRVPMAIVTSSKRDHFEEIHHHTRLLGFFDFVLTPDDYGSHKPHPEPYLTAAERLGVEPRDCVAVEDSERGVNSATTAGMICLAIPNELSRGGDLSRAHQILTNASEAADVIRLLVDRG